MGVAPRSVAQLVPSPPQGTQTDAAFADSFKSNHVTNVFATTQKISCYTPEVPYAGNLGPTNGYTGGTPCNGGANTSEDPRTYLTPKILNLTQLGKKHSKTGLRVGTPHFHHLIWHSQMCVYG